MTPQQLAQLAHNLLSDMREAGTPTHNVELSIGISAAVTELNDALEHMGFKPVDITWSDHT